QFPGHLAGHTVLPAGAGIYAQVQELRLRVVNEAVGLAADPPTALSVRYGIPFGAEQPVQPVVFHNPKEAVTLGIAIQHVAQPALEIPGQCLCAVGSAIGAGVGTLSDVACAVPVNLVCLLGHVVREPDGGVGSEEPTGMAERRIA